MSRRALLQRGGLAGAMLVGGQLLAPGRAAPPPVRASALERFRAPERSATTTSGWSTSAPASPARRPTTASSTGSRTSSSARGLRHLPARREALHLLERHALVVGPARRAGPDGGLLPALGPDAGGRRDGSAGPPRPGRPDRREHRPDRPQAAAAADRDVLHPDGERLPLERALAGARAGLQARLGRHRRAGRRAPARTGTGRRRRGLRPRRLARGGGRLLPAVQRRVLRLPGAVGGPRRRRGARAGRRFAGTAHPTAETRKTTSPSVVGVLPGTATRS